MIELSAIESLLRPEAQTTVFHASEVELSKVSGVLLDEIRKHNDGELSEVAEEFSNRGERRALIFRMKDRPRRTAWEVDSP